MNPDFAYKKYKKGVKITKSIKRVLSVLLCAAFFVTLLAGCQKSGTDSGKKTKEEQYLTYNMGQEPDTIDPGLETSLNAGNVDNMVFEGLMTLDEKNNPVPACAETVDYDPKNPIKFVFHLKKNLKWSDGQPLTAKDFEWSWKRVLNPATGADYASYLYYLKNGEAYNSKKAGITADDVGVKATDDYTLEVELENATPYFLQLCAFATLAPVRKDIVEKDPEKWTQDPKTYIGNGPFKMVEWVHDSYIKFEKNPNYWDKDNVKLDGAKFVMIAQSTQGLAAFETGDVDYIDDVPSAEIPRLLKAGTMVTQNYIGTYYLDVNNKLGALKDPRVRKALSLAIDRVALIETVYKDGRKPATAWVPYGISDADSSKQFRTVGGDYYNPQGDIAEAKKLLSDAGYPDGKGFPVYEYAYNKNETHALIAQAIQDMWKKNLGINVKLNEVDWKVFIPQRKIGDYQMSRDGWIGDYMDPSTFTDILRTGDGNNNAQYSNPRYDELLKKAKAEPDPAKRMEILHKAEDILIGEDMGIIPIAFYVRDVCKKPYIKGSYMVATGIVFFKKAYIEGKTAAK